MIRDKPEIRCIVICVCFSFIEGDKSEVRSHSGVGYGIKKERERTRRSLRVIDGSFVMGHRLYEVAFSLVKFLWVFACGAYFRRYHTFVDISAYAALPFDGLAALALPYVAILDELCHLVEAVAVMRFDGGD